MWSFIKVLKFLAFYWQHTPIGWHLKYYVDKNSTVLDYLPTSSQQLSFLKLTLIYKQYSKFWNKKKVNTEELNQSVSYLTIWVTKFTLWRLCVPHLAQASKKPNVTNVFFSLWHGVVKNHEIWTFKVNFFKAQKPRLINKSGFKSRADYYGAHTVYHALKH